MSMSRFWALLNKIQVPDKEEYRRTLISEVTKGRTHSLKEVTKAELYKLNAILQSAVGGEQEARDKWLAKSAERRELRRRICAVMADIGIDITDRERVDRYCLSPRIAGKKLNDLNEVELNSLYRKLKSIERKQFNNKEDGKQTNECSGSKKEV